MNKTFISFSTMLRREIKRFSRIWIQTIFAPVMSAALYFLVFGRFVGSQLPPIQGHAYAHFIVPGLVMMSVINNAYQNVVASVFGAKFQRQIEELLTSPLSNALILLGYLIGGICRSLLVGSCVLLIGCLLTGCPVIHPGSLLMVSFLCANLFATLGFINAVFARKFDDISLIPTFVLTPLIYLGGVFYAIEQLPPLWRFLSMFNPITHLVKVFRYSLLSGQMAPSITTMAVIVVWNILAILWAYRLFNRSQSLQV